MCLYKFFVGEAFRLPFDFDVIKRAGKPRPYNISFKFSVGDDAHIVPPGFDVIKREARRLPYFSVDVFAERPL